MHFNGIKLICYKFLAATIQFIQANHPINQFLHSIISMLCHISKHFLSMDAHLRSLEMEENHLVKLKCNTHAANLNSIKALLRRMR